MPKTVTKYVKHYHKEYKKEVRNYIQKEKKPKELHEWTEDKDHINWQYLANATYRIHRLERNFIIKQNLKDLLDAKEVRKIRNKILYEGTYKGLPEEEIRTLTRPIGKTNQKPQTPISPNQIEESD